MYTDRRGFVKQTLALGALSLWPGIFHGWSAQRSDMLMSLNPGAIGVQVTHQELVAYALKYGFRAITPLPELSQLSALEQRQVKEEMETQMLHWDAMGLPVEFRKTNEQFRKELYQLHTYADMLQNIGARAMTTWIMPMHDELTYQQNFDQHVERLREVARVLAASDLSLALEYVGPLSLMSSGKYPFISNLAELKKLIQAIGEPNVGVQLDAFHWYCAEETASDLLTLSPKDIITVDLNDAVAGRSILEQLDGERELPGASGVIDLSLFLNTLAQIGYSGPVRAEPFNAKLNALDNETAAKQTAAAMSKAMALIKG